MFVNNLVNNKAIYNQDVRCLTKFALLMARDQFRKDPPIGLPVSWLIKYNSRFELLFCFNSVLAD